MSRGRPLWRRVFDTLDVPLRENAETLAASKKFNEALLEIQKLSSELEATTYKKIDGIMHRLNIPSYSDITKLSRQIGALTHKVDTLQMNLEDIEKIVEESHEVRGPKETSPRNGSAKPKPTNTVRGEK